MKKSIIIVTSLIIAVLMVLTVKSSFQTGISLVCMIGVFAILFMSYFYFEKSHAGTKEIAIIATLSAFAAISRIIFALIPNVQPVTFLVAISGFVFGPYEGFLIGSTTAFLSDIFFGQGPWTPWQMFSWGLVGIISGILGKRSVEISTLKFSILCFLFGFMFDWIMNIQYILTFIKPVNLKTILAAYASGLTFDIIHGVSSFVFSIVFYKRFLPILRRYKRRLIISKIIQ
ncbi:MAG TPA: ECF transporter S component [Clostridium sp.]|mgnify:CR=1 FL=1|jgi:energy-coupling factor transport system substrate-specific component|uniref:ECF transporter S component n=1 Tax=Clostridium lapidicellarium TaxID=3240931 RepID=A0ABV4DWL4_9CLOT|nr:ECF transporter S component [uncultured Clostridium sp.]NLU08499.1 ECF transporter S component [Clostridiales bacterium]HBC95595.1 ECF transporter S component [Clostridium sp.]